MGLTLGALAAAGCAGTVIQSGEDEFAGRSGVDAAGSGDAAAASSLSGTGGWTQGGPGQGGTSISVAGGGARFSGAGKGGATFGEAGEPSTSTGGAGKGGAGKGGAGKGGAGKGGAGFGGAGFGGAGKGGAGYGAAGNGGASFGDAGEAGSAIGGAGGSGASAGGSGLPGVLLVPTDGWVDGASNALAIQGAIFPAADPTTMLSLTSDFAGANACIQGTAALVDMTSTQCMGTDCYGEFWGALIGMYLNQPLDLTTTPVTGGTPLAFDASALQGFSFELSGSIVPAPKDLRFQVESETTVFCTIATNKLHVGLNIVLFSELLSECYQYPSSIGPTAETAQSALVKVAWQVVTNTFSPVPYDFCVSNIRALLK